MEAIRSSETSALTNNTRRKIPGDCLRQGNERLYSIKGWVFLDWLSNFLLKADSAPWSNDIVSSSDYVEFQHRIIGGNMNNVGESGPTVV
jgi:hypothetical protein